jgi:hypothetical protein
MQALDEDVFPPVGLPVWGTDVTMREADNVDDEDSPVTGPSSTPANTLQMEAYVRGLKQLGIISCSLQASHAYRSQLQRMQVCFGSDRLQCKTNHLTQTSSPKSDPKP